MIGHAFELTESDMDEAGCPALREKMQGFREDVARKGEPGHVRVFFVTKSEAENKGGQALDISDEELKKRASLSRMNAMWLRHEDKVRNQPGHNEGDAAECEARAAMYDELIELRALVGRPKGDGGRRAWEQPQAGTKDGDK